MAAARLAAIRDAARVGMDDLEAGRFLQVAPDTLGIGRVVHDAMDADRHGTGVDDT
jgi:hypothetical protein